VFLVVPALFLAWLAAVLAQDHRGRASRASSPSALVGAAVAKAVGAF
jgi:hypothetical protein